jgi:hypothetical protein
MGKDSRILLRKKGGYAGASCRAHKKGRPQKEPALIDQILTYSASGINKHFSSSVS